MTNFFTRVLKSIRGGSQSGAEAATARGREAMTRGAMQEALEHFSTAVDCAPDNPILIFNRGFAYLEAGELELAKADFDRVIQMTPDDADPYFRRGLCHKKQNNHSAAVKDFSRAIKLQPEKAQLYNFRGLSLRELGEADKALADFDKALKVDPDNKSAHINRALILEDRGQHAEAIKALTGSIETDPDDADVWNRRGLLYDEFGKYNRAIADFTEALRLRPDTAAFYRNRASSFGETGRIREALADYQKCLRLDPQMIHALSGRGWLYATTKSAEFGLPAFEKGLADFERAAAVDPEYGKAYGGQSYCLARLGREREAFQAAEREIQLSQADGIRSRGHVNLILGRYEAGFTDLKEAFRLRPETAWWANQIAWMRATLPDPTVRNPAEALHYAKIACRLTGNKNWHFVNTLAAALADAGRWDEAVALQEKVVVALGHSNEQEAQLENYRNRRPSRNDYCDL